MSKQEIKLDENGLCVSYDPAMAEAVRRIRFPEHLGFRNDADESIFFARQLEHIKTQVWEVSYPAMKARDLVPVSTVADPADEYITYDQYDKMGMARVVRDYAKDFARIDVSGKQYTSKVVSLGDGFGYSVQELRASRKTGKPLDQKRAAAAQEAQRRVENFLVWFGNPADGQYGVLSHPNIGTVTIPSDGAGSSQSFSDKTPLQILRDLNLIANHAFVVSKGIEQSDTLLVSLDIYTLISTTPISNLATKTILQFFQENNPFITKVDWLNELTLYNPTYPGTQAGSADSILAYKRDPMKLTMEIPQDFEMFPPQESGMEFVVPCHSRYGGAVIYKPLSVTRADNCLY